MHDFAIAAHAEEVSANGAISTGVVVDCIDSVHLLGVRIDSHVQL